MLKMVEFDGLRARLMDLLSYLDRNPWTIGSEKSVIRPEMFRRCAGNGGAHRSLSR